MIWMTLWSGAARIAARVSLFATLILATNLVGACELLDVSDPTMLEDVELDNSTGADLLRLDAVTAFSRAIGAGALAGGILTDEFFRDSNPSFTFPSATEALDRRESEQYETLDAGSFSPYALWQEARHAAIAALPRVRAYTSSSARAAYTGQVLALRGYTMLRLAEDFCPGFPFNDIVNGTMVYGPPMTTAAALERALADFDSAVAYAADTARFLHLAQVGRARTLVGLGRFADAAEAVQPVPTDFAWRAEFAADWQPNPLVFTYSEAGSRTSVADGEGGRGIDFVSAKDPRVVTSVLGVAYDGTTSIRAIGRYADVTASIVAASGIEGRLIEAEAVLRANPDQPQWLTLLNTLRTDGTYTTQPNSQDPTRPDTLWNAGSGGVTGLAPLEDPESTAARVDLLFRERAFWLFATGTRLADLRRLVEHYDRSPESVYPTGAYRSGGIYGSGTSISFHAEAESGKNPAVTGCTSR